MLSQLDMTYDRADQALTDETGGDVMLKPEALCRRNNVIGCAMQQEHRYTQARYISSRRSWHVFGFVLVDARQQHWGQRLRVMLTEVAYDAAHRGTSARPPHARPPCLPIANAATHVQRLARL